ncbi:hypothetical protein HKX48_001719 [Thoreauomyces humboldtii]|nr:hypothetical protein HKX48_001719 [Thoreauomyces humboldtii]
MSTPADLASNPREIRRTIRGRNMYMSDKSNPGAHQLFGKDVRPDVSREHSMKRDLLERLIAVQKEIGRLRQDLELEDKQEWPKTASEGKVVGASEYRTYLDDRSPSDVFVGQLHALSDKLGDNSVREDRQPRHPAGPKRPATSYAEFVRDAYALDEDSQRERFGEDWFQAKDAGMRSKILGRTWRSMTDAERQVYHDRYLANKETYLGRIAEYAADRDLPKGPRAFNEVVAEKRPATPFAEFVRDAYALNEDSQRERFGEEWFQVKDAGMRSKILGRTWRSMTDAERQVYHDRYLANKETYLGRIAEYAADRDLPKGPRAFNEVVAEKRPATPFAEFVRDAYALNEDSQRERFGEEWFQVKDAGMRSKILGCTWHSMTDAERQVYRDRYHANKEAYSGRIAERQGYHDRYLANKEAYSGRITEHAAGRDLGR